MQKKMLKISSFIFLMIVNTFCKSGEEMTEIPLESLNTIAVYSVNIPELSGLTIQNLQDTTTLWTVSDETNQIYQIDLEGNVLQELPFVGDDLEGIAYSPSKEILWVVEEGRREILKLDLTGNLLKRIALPIRGKKNKGLEGICINADNQIIALHEKSPGLLLALDDDCNIETQHELSFAGDYSGITYNAKDDFYWILSDNDETLYGWHPQNGVIKKYALPITKPEGIAVDMDKNRCYIVSDSENKLYVFSF